MTIRERIELLMWCMDSIPQDRNQFSENYKWYSRLLKVWHKRYCNY